MYNLHCCIQLEVGKLDSFTTRKYTEKVRIGRGMKNMSQEKVEENRNVNLRGKMKVIGDV